MLFINCDNIVNMRLWWKVISSKNFLPVVVVIFFAVLASRTLIFQKGYFNMHDDLQMMRQLEMEKCFLDLQIPCRWVPDMGYGFGFPLFNFYPPLPYLVGQVIRLVGVSFITTVKLTFALSIVVSGIGMYLLAKEFFGRVGGILSSVFYIWAPYHAVDVYVRGAMNEAWALTIFPFIFWTSYRLIRSDKVNEIRGLRINKWVVPLALSYTTLFLSHNLMVMVFTPVFAGWVLIFLWVKNAWNKTIQLTLSGILALGLSAFFTLPAVFENKFTHIKDQLIGYYDYTAHFVSIKQLLWSRFWEYGPSVWGVADDRMSFQIGHLHWILSLLIGLGIAIGIARMIKGSKKISEWKRHPVLLVLAYLLVVGWLLAFLTHSRSTPIWLSIPQLKYLQFPWRFLAIITFCFSFIVGIIPGAFAKLKSHHKLLARLALSIPQLLIATTLVLLMVTFNWKYFLPEYGKMGKLTDEEKFSDAAWELQQTAGIFDYLPSAAETAPKSPRTYVVEIMEGDVVYRDVREGTDWLSFEADVKSDTATLRLGIMDFPGWKVDVNNKTANKFIGKDEKWGRIYINLTQGVNKVQAELVDTPTRRISNYISIVSWITLLSYIIWRKSYSQS